MKTQGTPRKVTVRNGKGDVVAVHAVTMYRAGNGRWVTIPA